MLVIGAQKSGTTSLWQFLRQHPDIFMAPDKELHFFDRAHNWSRGVGWYEQQFAQWQGERVVGEATPAYARFPLFRDVPARAHSVVPDARLIYVVRQPVDRIRSHYLHDRAYGFERDSFAHAVLTKSTYVDTSRYAMQVNAWLRYYPRSSLLVITSEDLRDRCTETMSEVYEFLGVDPQWSPAGGEHHRTGDTLTKPTALLRLQNTTACQLALEHVSPGMKRRVARPLTAVINRPVSTAGAVFDADLRGALEDLVRDDVRQLRAYLPSRFDGWGID